MGLFFIDLWCVVYVNKMRAAGTFSLPCAKCWRDTTPDATDSLCYSPAQR